MDDFHLNIKVLLLPLNSMSNIQPIDQGMIVTFKKYYLHCTLSGSEDKE